MSNLLKNFINLYKAPKQINVDPVVKNISFNKLIIFGFLLLLPPTLLGFFILDADRNIGWVIIIIAIQITISERLTHYFNDGGSKFIVYTYSKRSIIISYLTTFPYLCYKFLIRFFHAFFHIRNPLIEFIVLIITILFNITVFYYSIYNSLNQNKSNTLKIMIKLYLILVLLILILIEILGRMTGGFLFETLLFD